jgi:cytochrome bd ubiquinol oxidase subunit I
MSDLLAARSQMAMSLAFHIIFAVVGIGMPLLMVVAERRWQVTGDPVYLDLAKRWAKGTAIMFAVGAVSGTVLSFELGLLWPWFMELAGPIIGMPFSLECFAFFVDAIFLGIYLYGWDRLSPRAHLSAGILVAVSGALSGIFVVIANAWMNTPTGFEMVHGAATNIDPIGAILNPAAFTQTLHMTLAAYAATGFGVAGIHAFLLRKRPLNAFHRRALAVGLLVGGPAALLQPLSGDLSGKMVARTQPAKFAAMEAHFHTEAPAALVIGGIPDPATGEVPFAIRVPRLLSFLAHGDFTSEVRGLDQVPRDEWPNVRITHLSFQVMVGLGMYLLLVTLWAAWLWRRGNDLALEPRFLGALVLATPMGFVAIEAGWMVTEVGRQPWIIQGVMRTADAVTTMPGLIVPFLFFTALYLALAVAVTWLLYRQIVKSPEGEDWQRRYAPAPEAQDA